MVTSQSYNPRRSAPVIAKRSASVIAIKGHPVYLMFGHFPIACFTLTVLTDLAYWRTSNLLWHDFSAWLLLAGLVMGGIELLVLLIDVIWSPALRATGLGWVVVLGLLIVLLLGTWNSFVHARDGWPGVVPWGLTLSVVTFLVMILTAWFGREMAIRSTNAGRI